MTGDGPTAVLLLSCPDQKGLLSEVSSFIYRHGGNIVHAEQHIDAPQSIFFHRVEWDLNGFNIPSGELEVCFRPIADRFQMRWHLGYSNVLRRIAIFVSKYDHCLLDLLYRHGTGELPAEIVAIVSNHQDLQPVAAQHGIPFFCFSGNAGKQGGAGAPADRFAPRTQSRPDRAGAIHASAHVKVCAGLLQPHH